MAVQLKPMSDISMLTMLLQASAIVKNQTGDSSLHGYVEMQEMASQTTLDTSKDADFALLDCLSDILVQDTQVLAASYDDATSFTLVTPSANSVPELDDSHTDSIDMEFPPLESVSSATTFKSINAAVIPNPNDRRKDSSHLDGPLGKIREIGGGKSLWSASGEPLQDVLNMDVKTPEGLANHAESVSCYLYEYGRSDRALRSNYSKTFFLYLLAASWMKQHSRFCSWRALSFIQELEKGITGDVIVSQIEDIGSNYGPPPLPQELGRGDRTLADFFSKNKTYLRAMMEDAHRTLPPQLSFRLSKLVLLNSSPSGSEDDIHNKILTLNAFGEAVEHTLKEKKTLYTKETALTFHCLLYFSFLMAGRALRAIKDSYQALNPGKSKLCEEAVEKYKEAIGAAELPVRFLICMLSSKAFKSHMRVWTNEGASLKLILPRFEEKRNYMIFGKDRYILASSKQGPSPDSELEDPEDDDTIDSEVPESPSSFLMFNRWVTIFVAHFLAKRTLEYQSTRIFQAMPTTFKKPKIRVFAVSSEQYLVPPWAEFERVIREAFTSRDEKDAVELIIATLVEKVREGKGLTREVSQSHPLKVIRNVINGDMPTYKLRMHCEAVFAALLEAHNLAQLKSSADTDTDLETLAKFFKTLHPDMIAVSKLCCPVCWELFKVLNLKLDIKIRGCHPTVTPLALPETLSPDIYNGIITSLRPQLTAQLKHLLDDKRARTTQHHRNESETGHSARSSNEGASDCLSSYEKWTQQKKRMEEDQRVDKVDAGPKTDSISSPSRQ